MNHGNISMTQSTLGGGLEKLRAILDKLDKSSMAKLPVGVAACGERQNLTNMFNEHPALFVPVYGGKTIRFGLDEFSATAGELLLVPGHISLSVTNQPDRSYAGFLGVSIQFDCATIKQFHTMFGRTLEPSGLSPNWSSEGWTELYWMIAEWIEYSTRFPTNIEHSRHKLVEFLFLLSRKGIAGNILNSPQQAIGNRIRSHLATDPSRDWRASDLASELGMSESTLRRRLRAETTTFRAILEAARLDQGIHLVLFTGMPIGQVSFACGYQSQSRFAERFKRRFSMSPTEVRATRRSPRHASHNVVEDFDRLTYA